MMSHLQYFLFSHHDHRHHRQAMVSCLDNRGQSAPLKYHHGQTTLAGGRTFHHHHFCSICNEPSNEKTSQTITSFIIFAYFNFHHGHHRIHQYPHLSESHQ